MIGRAVVRLGLAGLAVALVGVGPGPVASHHVGVYVPRDNEVSANFKQLKFAIQAGKLDVAARLFEAGAVRAEMRAQASRLPAGLEEATRAALRNGDARGAERGLMIFFAALARDLAREADRRLADPGEPVEARVAAGRKFLEAIWRYYNLVDFAVAERDPKAATAVRLAFEDAEGAAKLKPPAPDRVREPLQRIAHVLADLIARSGFDRSERLG